MVKTDIKRSLLVRWSFITKTFCWDIDPTALNRRQCEEVDAIFFSNNRNNVRWMDNQCRWSIKILKNVWLNKAIETKDEQMIRFTHINYCFYWSTKKVETISKVKLLRKIKKKDIIFKCNTYLSYYWCSSKNFIQFAIKSLLDIYILKYIKFRSINFRCWKLD